MRTLSLLLLVAFGLLAAPSASAQPAPPSESYLLLKSGERLAGPVHVSPDRGLPDYAVVGAVRYPMSDVEAYVVDGVEYTVVRGGDYALVTGSLRPLLLVRQSTEHLSQYEAMGGGITFFRLGDGPLMVQTSSRLRAALSAHPEATHHLARERVYGRYGLGAMALGAGLVMSGAAVELTPLDGPSGVLLAGSGVLVAAAANAVVPILQGNARRDAVQAFNR